MNRQRILIGLLTLGLLMALAVGMAVAQGPGPQGEVKPQVAMTTAFTYQGRLTDGDGPANGRYDFQFDLYDAARDGKRVGTETVEDVVVTDGLFTAQLDFGSVFDGRMLWLEIGVRPATESGAYTTLSPRQSLTAAPYAFYSLETARHSHWGEWWTGRGVGLTLSSSDDDGLNATGSTEGGHYGGWFQAYHGVYGEGTGATGQGGIFISENDDGVRVESAGDDGVDVGSAEGDGVHARGGSDADDYGGWFRAYHGVYGEATGVAGTGGTFSSASYHGVRVESAGDDGVHVDSAGTPSTMTPSVLSNGFEVTGASGNGMHVGRADETGVYVATAGFDGLHVDWAGGDGMYVGRAGDPSATEWSPLSNGLEVAGAEDHGVFVGQADSDGVHVLSAGGNGLFVEAADNDGVHVHEAGNPVGGGLPSSDKNGLEVERAEGYGVWVSRAAKGGVHVTEAGSPSVTFSSIESNGFEVDGADGHGLYVGWADKDGVRVHGAIGDGVHVTGAYGRAGYFDGDVEITGSISKGSGSFKIDHPLDPENQYLYHSFVESPDMMNIYNGNVSLDAHGEAWVALPDWLEALNRDFRYQLTPIGGPGPGLYIAEKVQNNRFKIAGGEPGLEVSWQVTGIRHDAYAEANRISVEEEKPADERGTYLHPEAHGQPETSGLAHKEAQARGSE